MGEREMPAERFERHRTRLRAVAADDETQREVVGAFLAAAREGSSPSAP